MVQWAQGPQKGRAEVAKPRQAPHRDREEVVCVWKRRRKWMKRRRRKKRRKRKGRGLKRVETGGVKQAVGRCPWRAMGRLD
jgi:hypothetical protein